MAPIHRSQVYAECQAQGIEIQDLGRDSGGHEALLSIGTSRVKSECLIYRSLPRDRSTPLEVGYLLWEHINTVPSHFS